MKTAVLCAVVVHFLLAGWHGYSHQMIPVPLNGAQTAFVVIVIIALPIIGAGLCLTSMRTKGALLVCLSLLASFLFGLVYHFIHASPDHISAVPQGPWRSAFVVSAVLLALIEVVGAIVGGMAWQRWKGAITQVAAR
jgi:hypothetical protein